MSETSGDANVAAISWHDITAKEIKEGIEYLNDYYSRNSRHPADHCWREFCMDWNKNQTGGCCCVKDLVQKKLGHDEGDLEDYETICVEIADWFREAGILEEKRRSKRISQKQHWESFVKSIVLQKSQKGVFTRMLDLSVLPGMPDSDYDEELGVHVTQNVVVTEATMCLNSVLHLWTRLTGTVFGGDKSVPGYLDWKSRNYNTILRWCSHVQEDVATQIEKQRLFYARVPDFLVAKENAGRIAYNHALEKYQQNFGVDCGETEEKLWRDRMKKKWKRWNLESIHILNSGTSWEYNGVTKGLVKRLGVKICRVTEETVNTLHELAISLEKHRALWRVVNQDKKLLFFSMKNCHDVTSAINGTFLGSKRGAIGNKMKDEDFVSRIAKVDEELRTTFLDMINETAKQGKKVKEVAFQLSVLMAKTHATQHPHWDYANGSNNRDNFMVAFLPLTDTGQFIQMWEHESGATEDDKREGEICFIPKGDLVLVPGNVLHGGGFRAETESNIHHAHMRAHFYVYPGETGCMITTHRNEYTDTDGSNMEDIYENNRILSGKIETDGTWSDSLDWTFFQGKRPFDQITGKELKKVQKRKGRK
jgi:hypothetical protein